MGRHGEVRGAEFLPGPMARVIARPRASVILFGVALIVLGVQLLVEQASVFGPLVGGLGMVFVGGWIIVWTMSMRVWLDGSLLIARNVRGRHTSVRLDALSMGYVVDSPGAGTIVVLRDANHGSVELSAMSIRLVRLYRLFAELDVVGRGGHFDEGMRARIDSHRSQ